MRLFGWGNTARKIEPPPELEPVPKQKPELEILKKPKDAYLEKAAKRAEAREIELEYLAEQKAEKRKVKKIAPAPAKPKLAEVKPIHAQPAEEEEIDLSSAFDTPEEVAAKDEANWQAEMDAAIKEQLEADRLAKEAKVREMEARRAAAELKRQEEAARKAKEASLGTEENPIELKEHDLEYPEETAFFEPRKTNISVTRAKKEKPLPPPVESIEWEEEKQAEIASQTPVLTGKPIEPVLTGAPLGTEDNPIELEDSDLQYIQPSRREKRQVRAKAEGPTAAEIQMHQEFYSTESAKYNHRAQLMERTALTSNNVAVAEAQLKAAQNARVVANLADYLANSYQTAETLGQPLNAADNQTIIEKLELATAEFEESLKDIQNERLADQMIADLKERHRWKLQAEVDKLRRLKDKTDNNITNLQIAMSGVKRSIFGWLKNKFSSEGSRLMDEINAEEKNTATEAMISAAEQKINEINNQLETLTVQLNALVSPEERQQSPSEEKAAEAQQETETMARIKQMQKSGQLRGTGGSSGAGQGKLQGVTRRADSSNYRGL